MENPFRPLLAELIAALTEQAQQRSLFAPLLLALCAQLRRVLLSLDKLFDSLHAAQTAPAPPSIRRATPPRTRRGPRPYIRRQRPRPIRRAMARIRTSAPRPQRSRQARAIQHTPQHKLTFVNRHRR
jgi:hypothetical protein